MRRGLSLGWRVILLVAGIPVLVLAPWLLYTGARYRTAYREGLWSKADLATIQLQQFVRASAPDAETLSDVPGLSAYLLAVANEVPEFQFVAVVDNEGRALKHSAPGSVGNVIEGLQNLEYQVATRDGVSRYGVLTRDLESGRAYVIWRPLEMPDATAVGASALYIVVAEPANVVNPSLLPMIILGIAASVGAMLVARTTLYRRVLRPLYALAEGATIVGGGDLGHVIEMDRDDEFGLVARTFNQMAQRLSEMMSRLERRVEERTAALERRNAQLEAVSAVGREAASEHNVSALLDTAVNAISSSFGFYHTGIFILDDARAWAILRAASSEGGRRMLARGHRLQVGQVGIVGYVAATGKPRIAFNVGEDVVWFRNADLPETRSEMALPLLAEGQVVGVLDVQSDEESAFSDEDVSTLQLMADQLVVALNNARALETAESALAELRALQVDYGRRGWARVTDQIRPLAYEYDRVSTTPVPPLPVPSDLADGSVPYRVISDGSAPLAMEALRVGGQTLGYLGLSDPKRAWTEEELALVQSVGEQVALALDNARLFEDTQRNERQQYLISAVLQAASNPDWSAEQILAEIGRILAQGLDLGVAIFTFPYPALPIVRAHAVVDVDGTEMPLLERDLALSEEHAVFLRGLTEPMLGPMPLGSEVLLSSALVDAGDDGGAIDAPARASSLGFEQVLYVPIATAGVRAGFIGLLQGPDAPPLDPDTRELAQNLASQIAVVLENLNLSEETQRRSEDLRQLYRISLELGELLSPEDVLNVVASRGAVLLGADAANLWVYDPATRELTLAYDFGEGAEGRLGFRTRLGEGLAGRALAEQQTITIEDYAEWSGRISGLVSGRFRAMMAVPLVGRSDPAAVRRRAGDGGGDAGGVEQTGVDAHRPDEGRLGVLVVLSERVAYFGEREAGLAELFSAQAVTALENARLTQEAQRRAAEFSQLYEAGIDLITIRDSGALLDRAAEWSRHVFGAERAVVFLRDAETGGYLRGHSASDPRYLPGNESDQPSAGGFTESIIRDRRSVLVRDNRTASLPSARRLVEIGLLSQMGAPLQVGAEVLGALFVNGAEVGQFTARDLTMLEFLATQVSSALQNSIQFGQTARALSVVGRQARYQSNISRAVALLNERGASATQDVLQLLAEAAEVPVVLYFGVETGARHGQAAHDELSWRLEGSWIAEGRSPERLADTRLQRLPVGVLPFWDETLRQRGSIVARLEDLPEAEQELLLTFDFLAALGLAVPGDTPSPGFILLLRDEELALWDQQEVVALQTVAAALSNTLAREKLFEQVQETLSETETLYRGSAALSEASTYQAILDVLVSYSVLGEGAQTATLQLFDRTWVGNDLPRYSEVVAVWDAASESAGEQRAGGVLPSPEAAGLGQRYEMQRFPTALAAMRDGSVVFVEDLADDTVLDRSARALFRRARRAGSLIIVPLLAGGQRIGYLHADFAAPRAFSDPARRRLVSLAQQAGVAVLNIRQLQATEARVRREQLIRQLTGRIQEAPDVQGVLQTAVRELGRAFGTSRNRIQFRPPQEHVDGALQPDAEATAQEARASDVGEAQVYGDGEGDGSDQ